MLLITVVLQLFTFTASYHILSCYKARTEYSLSHQKNKVLSYGINMIKWMKCWWIFTYVYTLISTTEIKIQIHFCIFRVWHSGGQTFSVRDQLVNILGLMGYRVFCQSGKLSQESSHRQHVNEHAWPCSNKLYLQTCVGLDLAWESQFAHPFV